MPRERAKAPPAPSFQDRVQDAVLAVLRERGQMWRGALADVVATKLEILAFKVYPAMRALEDAGKIVRRDEETVPARRGPRIYYRAAT